MVPLGSISEIAENKLVLLYLFEKIDLTLSSLQVYKIILEHSFMDYFMLQHTLDELAEQGLLNSVKIDGKHAYSLSPEGSKTLGYFIAKISVGIKRRIDESVSSIRKQIRNETKITADYTPESETEFVVTLAVHEDNFPLIDLKLTVGTKNDAREICKNWLMNPQAIYSGIIKCLTEDRSSGSSSNDGNGGKNGNKGNDDIPTSDSQTQNQES
ncbi:MAG: DUF4364 family protein [Eubacteriales bacterium]|nr:DUF4364 family protein [Eubacteriales bacterium]